MALNKEIKKKIEKLIIIMIAVFANLMIVVVKWGLLKIFNKMRNHFYQLEDW
jgi:hypothetical protein